MLRLALPIAMAAIALSGSLTADDKKAGPATPAFELFKKLAGEWVGKEKGMDMTVVYKVTSGGTAVTETLFPGTEHEMVSIVHPDGNDLLFTHYCMLGNQPQMKAPGKVDGNKVAFKFVKATNLKSENDKHMHDVTFTFIDDDTLETEWSHCADGKTEGKVVFKFKRKK